MGSDALPVDNDVDVLRRQASELRRQATDLNRQAAQIERQIRKLSGVTDDVDAATGPRPVMPPIDILSDREREVFRLMGRGLDMNEIAKQMQLSAKTVETYRARIRKKLDLSSRMGLVRLAVEWEIKHRVESLDGPATM